MSATELGTGYATSSKEARKAVARSEAAASVHLQRDRSTLYGGICVNCEKLDTCNFPSTTSETWFCEEYAVARANKQMRTADVEVEGVPGTTAGLCVNCERRATCTLPKAEGGVWFCNEYE